MPLQRQTSQQYFKSITILYFALLFGQVAFAAITLYLNLGLLFQADDTLSDLFIYIVPFFVVNGFVVGHFIYKSRLKKIKTYNSLMAKMGEYRSAMIIRFSMLEGASFFAIVAYFLTANLFFMAMTGLVVAYFIIIKPTIGKISMDLELDSAERLKLENPEEIIAEFEIND